MIMDVMMPGLDGSAACRALKADPATAGILVVWLVGAWLAARHLDQGEANGTPKLG